MTMLRSVVAVALCVAHHAAAQDFQDEIVQDQSSGLHQQKSDHNQFQDSVWSASTVLHSNEGAHALYREPFVFTSDADLTAAITAAQSKVLADLKALDRNHDGALRQDDIPRCAFLACV